MNYSVEVLREEYPLSKPYKLSFVTIETFVSLQVRFQLEDGTSSLAEVVPLPGYSDETEDYISEKLNGYLELSKSLALTELRQRIAEEIPKHPFATTAFLTGIDLLESPVSESNNDLDFVVPTSTRDPEELINKCNDGDKFTVKIKLSDNVEADLSALRILSDAGVSVANLRFDANQAYSLDNTRKFFSMVSGFSFWRRVELIEQPLDKKDWVGVETLMQEFPGHPLMLDEPIVTESDLERAVSLKVPWIKLKLFKQGGISETIDIAKKAKASGLKVVLGNGVATKISNDVENMIFKNYSELFDGASEGNGFLKVRR